MPNISRIEDFPVEPRLLSDILSGCFHGAIGSARHAFDMQIFHRDQRIVPCDVIGLPDSFTHESKLSTPQSSAMASCATRSRTIFPGSTVRDKYHLTSR